MDLASGLGTLPRIPRYMSTGICMPHELPYEQRRTKKIGNGGKKIVLRHDNLFCPFHHRWSRWREKVYYCFTIMGKKLNTPGEDMTVNLLALVHTVCLYVRIIIHVVYQFIFISLYTHTLTHTPLYLYPYVSKP